MTRGTIVRASQRSHVWWMSGFVSANLAALFADLIAALHYYDAHDSTNYVVPQDIWGPFLCLMLAQALLNAIVLTIPKRTRSFGYGILLGTTGFVGLLLASLVVVVLPALGD